MKARHLSERNRIVRHFTALRRSAGLTFTIVSDGRSAPEVILRWTLPSRPFGGAEKLDAARGKSFRIASGWFRITWMTGVIR